MYSVVLATMLTAGGAAPDWHGCFGCSCACSGCHGNAFSSCNCCGGCFGCWGCSGCRGCWGGSGCWGCTGCRGCWGWSFNSNWGGSSCFNCYGCSCFSSRGCYGCGCFGTNCFGCQGCSGCRGCTGGGAAPGSAPAPGAKPATKPEPKKADAGPAHITVHVPADAKLTVDGVECPLTSETRTFDTPTLQPGQQFYYTVKAEVIRDGKPVSVTRRVIFESGNKIDLEFRLPVETARR